MIQPCVADSPRRRTPGASGCLRVPGGGVGESAYHERLVGRKHHPQLDGEAAPAIPPSERSAGCLLESEGTEQTEGRVVSSVIAANTRVAPRLANRFSDSMTRVRAIPCRRKFVSTAMKYTYPIGGVPSNHRPTRKPAGTPSWLAMRNGHAPRIPRTAKNA